MKEGEDTYSLRLGARKAGVSTGLMYRLLKANQTPGVIRIGEKRIVLSKAVFDRWLPGEGIIPVEKASGAKVAQRDAEYAASEAAAVTDPWSDPGDIVKGKSECPLTNLGK